MNGQINYARIAKFLHTKESECLERNDTKGFEKVHKKLNRLFCAWGMSRSHMTKISEIKMKKVSL